MIYLPHLIINYNHHSIIEKKWKWCNTWILTPRRMQIWYNLAGHICLHKRSQGSDAGTAPRITHTRAHGKARIMTSITIIASYIQSAGVLYPGALTFLLVFSVQTKWVSFMSKSTACRTDELESIEAVVNAQWTPCTVCPRAAASASSRFLPC